MTGLVDWKEIEAQVAAQSKRRTEPRELKVNHGTRSGYNRGCNCDRCRQANNNYMRDHRDTRAVQEEHRTASVTPELPLPLIDPTGPLAWQADALCAQADPEAWFPEKGGLTREPKAVCRRCPVKDPCLEYALDNQERFGVWGGMSERERRRLQPPKAEPWRSDAVRRSWQTRWARQAENAS